MNENNIAIDIDGGQQHLKQLSIEISNLCYSVKVPAPKTVVADKSTKSSRPFPFGKGDGVKFVDKPILQNISGRFKAGKLTAIMGASGAGKTSLLNVLAGEVGPQQDGKSAVSGKISVNGLEIGFGSGSTTTSKDCPETSGPRPSMKKLSGFVFQDDVILSTMTVKEAISMSATLRLPKTITKEEKQQKVEELLQTLRLKKAENTIIGSTIVKGISGGERKRTALSMEMVTNPSILFLDEPTSGLDTFTAFNVCDILRNLSRTGRTVIATIHQPSSEIFHLFDDLCLLAEGQVMYWGPVAGVVQYFASLNYPCPTFTNPADFLFMTVLNTEGRTRAKVMQLLATPEEGNNKPDEVKRTVEDRAMTVDSTKHEDQDEVEKKRIAKLLSHWHKSPEAKLLEKEIEAVGKEAVKDRQGNMDYLAKSTKFKSDLATQFAYLFGRAWRNAMRNKFIVKVRFAQSLFIALLIGLIYLNQPSKDLNSQIQNYAGAIFFACTNMVMGSSIGVLSIFAAEKAVFAREHANGYYGLSAYFFSKIIVELPFQIIFPIIQAAIMYWMVGFNGQPWYAFIVFAFTLVLLTLCGNAMGIFFASVFSDLTVALAVTPMVILPLMIFGGLFVNNGSIPPYFDWIKWISPIKYGFEALIKNQFAQWEYVMPGPGGRKTTGAAIITQLGLDDGLSIEICLLILFCLFVGLLTLAFYALRRSVKVKAH